MKSVVLPLSLVLIAPLLMAQADGKGKGAPPAPKAKAKEGPSPAEVKKYELDVWAAIAKTSGAIDSCTQRYTSEFPTRKGEVALSFSQYSEDRVRLTRVGARSTVQQAEKLELCLKAVAMGWRFPPWKWSSPLNGLTVRVEKGVKFKLLKPGEKPPEPKKAENKGEGEPEGYVGFKPNWSFQGDE